MTDTLVQPPVAEKEPWFRVWFRVYFSPSVGTFQSILQAGEVKLSRATTWVMAGAAFTAFFPILMYLVSGGKLIHDDLTDAQISGEVGWVMYVLSGIFAVVLTAIFFPLTVHVINWLAKKFGGTGNPEQLGFLLGAIRAPAGILESLLEGLLPLGLGLAFRILILVIEAFLVTVALKAAASLSWGRAVGVTAILAGAIGLLAAMIVGCLLLAG